jgi:hypothetical protein
MGGSCLSAVERQPSCCASSTVRPAVMHAQLCAAMVVLQPPFAAATVGLRCDALFLQPRDRVQFHSLGIWF